VLAVASEDVGSETTADHYPFLRGSRIREEIATL
jgi:hypothetical protein